ncbi:hypothetical protein K438DRAFT_2030411 [Mycena galopus ATCC 62051]|nr:hypothetical protein K438DRAFT_2030411 [Mycena galopus ATCC 62051]
MALPNFTFSSTADEVAVALATEIAGKNVLITGTTIGGIGFETARVVAKFANLVIITGYNADRLQLSKQAIEEETPSANIRCLHLDLASFAAVRQAAAEVSEYPEALHVLINNAAGGSERGEPTIDGLNSMMATDYFGPFLFTALLVPKFLTARNSSDNFVPRVVFLSSVMHARGPGIDLAALRSNAKHGDPAATRHDGYHQAKCANVMSAIELSRRAQGRVHAYSLHPGVIFTNAHQREELATELKARGVLDANGQPNRENTSIKWKTIQQGAATTLAAAFDPRLNDKPGAYLTDSTEANDAIALHCADLERCEELWNITEDIVGVTVAF